MKPANGSYRLRSNPNPPGKPDMRLTISGDSISGWTGEATCGRYEYYPAPQDWFGLGGPPPKVVIRFTGPTEFVAIVNPGGPGEQQYTGTYAPEP